MLTHTQTPIWNVPKKGRLAGWMTGWPTGQLIDWVSEINVVNWMCFSAPLTAHWFRKSSARHSKWSGGFMCGSAGRTQNRSRAHESTREVASLTCVPKRWGEHYRITHEGKWRCNGGNNKWSNSTNFMWIFWFAFISTKHSDFLSPACLVGVDKTGAEIINYFLDWGNYFNNRLIIYSFYHFLLVICEDLD